MNRRERRKLSKNLGIMEYQRKLPINKKFELIRENIISGKRIHQEFVEKNRIIQEQYSDEIISNQLYYLASQIAEREKIPFVDAIEKAKIQLYEENKQQLEKN